MRPAIQTTAALLIGALLGASAMLPWIGGEGAPLPQNAEVRFVADPDWWPKPPRCPPASTTTPPAARDL